MARGIIAGAMAERSPAASNRNPPRVVPRSSWRVTTEPAGDAPDASGAAVRGDTAKRLLTPLLAMNLGRRATPIQRPSGMAEVRSEALWTDGVDACAARVLHLVESVGGVVVMNQLSRVDPRVDVLLPEAVWRADLRERFVMRATKADPHLDRRRLTGFSIGRGAVSARLYDKPREIMDKSKKFWMYDVWGVDTVSEAERITRVEYRVRCKCSHQTDAARGEVRRRRWRA